MLAKVYYTIWTDCIKKIQTVPASKANWKFITLVFMSTLMGLNLMFLSVILPNQFLWNFLNYLKIDYFKGNTLDTLFNGLIQFMLPMLIINYLLIFRNDRYKKIIDNYNFYNGKYFLKYLLASLWIPFVLLIAGMLYVIFFSKP